VEYDRQNKVLSVRNEKQVNEAKGVTHEISTGQAFVIPPSPGDVFEWYNGGAYILNANPSRNLTCLNIVLAGKVDDWNAGWEQSINGSEPLPLGSKGAMFYYTSRWINEGAKYAPETRFIYDYSNYNVNGKLWGDAKSNWASLFYAAYAKAIWPQQGIQTHESYVQRRVVFDGTTRFTRSACARDFVDGPQGTFSVWLDFANADNTTARIINLATCFQVLRGSDNRLRALLYNNALPRNQIVWDAKTNARYRTAAGLIHIALAWDLSAAAPIAQIAIDGKLLEAGKDYTEAVTPTAAHVNYGQSIGKIMGFGALPSGAAATDGFKGEMGDLFFDTTFLDLSVPGNLQKFIEGGQPVRPQNFGTIFFGDDMSAADWNVGGGKGSVTGWLRTGGELSGVQASGSFESISVRLRDAGT
jgi:hypothetical protein